MTADSILASLPDGPVWWLLPGSVQQQAGGNQLEVFITGTASTCQCFGESDHNPARDRDHGLYMGLPTLWPCPVAAARL